MEGTHKNHCIQPPGHAQNSIKNPIMCLKALPKLWQSWCCIHFPGETVPVPSRSLLEEAFLNTQPKPPLTWPHAAPLGPVTGQREETSASPSHFPSRGSWTDQVTSATSRMVSILGPLLSSEIWENSANFRKVK